MTLSVVFHVPFNDVFEVDKAIYHFPCLFRNHSREECTAQNGHADICATGEVVSRLVQEYNRPIDAVTRNLSILAAKDVMRDLALDKPNRDIMSTNLVQCQRRDWCASAICSSVPSLRRMSLEIFDIIIEKVNGYQFRWRRA